MSTRIALSRHLEMQRGGLHGNQAGPVWSIRAQNGSGGAVARGDIVVWDKDSSSTADKISFTTTTTENNPDVLGMVLDTSVASGAWCNVQIYGPTSFLKVDGTDDIAVGDYISTFSTAKIGQKTTGAGSFAMALEAYTTNDSSGVIDAFINCLGSSFGGAASVSWYRDNVPAYFGNANDMAVQWNGTNFTIIPVADDTGRAQVGDGTTDVDFRFYLGDSSTHVTMDVGAQQVILSGTAITFASGTSASTAGSGTALTASRTAAFSVFSDDGNAAISSATLTRAGRFRNLQTYTAGNREQEAVGLIGQLVSVAGTNRHNMAGLMGSYEGSGALTIDGQAWSTDPWIQAGVIGRVGVGSGVATVNANGILAGLAAMSNTASFSAQNGLYTGLYVGSWSGATDFEVGIYIQAGAVTKGIQVGELSSTTAGSGVTLDATTTRAMEVHADDNNAARAVGTQGRAIFGRTMIYADNACEDWGVHGLSKISAVAKTGNVSAGVVGAFESTGVCSLATGSGNCFVAGVMGRLGGGGTFTLNAGTYAVGVLAFNNTATAFTNTGTCAFMATKSDIAGTVDWDYGVYVEDANVGIQFAHTLTPDSTRTNRAIGIGSRATEMDVTMAGDNDQNLDPIQVNMNIIGSNPGNSSTLNTFYSLITHDTTDMSNMRLKNSDWNIVVGKDVKDVYCYQGEVDFNASGIAVGGEAAVMGLTLDAGSNAVTGNLWGAIIVTQGAGIPSGSSAGLFLSHRGTGTLTHSLYIEANSGATITDAIYINPAGTITNALTIAALGGPAQAYSAAGTGAYSIKCKINGVTTYIHTYDAP